jgi:methane monooxygenase PmoA-like
VTAAQDPGQGGTSVERGPDSMTIAGCWTYHWGAKRRPFIHPLRTRAGHVLTCDAPDDHPWHHGLWFAVKYIDGDNFWEEMAPYGVLRHDGPPDVETGSDGRVTLRGALRWTRPDRETVAIHERRSLTHVPIDAASYAIDVSTVLVPTADAVLDRTPFTTWGGYGGLTLRGPGDWHDTRLLLGDGRDVQRVVGEPAPWCALTGIVGAGNAETIAGLAMFDAPSNVRHPVPWYGSTRADTYGDDGWSNFFNAAFLFHAPMSLAAGEELRIDHRVVVHDGDWDHDTIAELYGRWTGEPTSV